MISLDSFGIARNTPLQIKGNKFLFGKNRDYAKRI
jgi:hypothetical protein